MSESIRLTFPEGKDLDAVGFGTNAVDFLINVPQYPTYNSKVEISSYVQAAGGEISSTMAGLSRLGLKTAYIGRFGDDIAGDIGIRSLEDDGVDITYAERVKGADTQIGFIVIDERTGERTVLWRRDAALSYMPGEAPLDAARRCRVLHMTQHDVSACVEMAEAAHDAGALVSLDVDNVVDGIDRLLGCVDIFVSSEEFPVRLTGENDLESALKTIAGQYKCKATCATLGVSGSIMLVDGELIRTRGFEVPGGCKDTTGAGDAFRTGLLYGLLSGRPVADAARMANAVAALKCRSVGARNSLPNVEQLTTFLKNV